MKLLTTIGLFSAANVGFSMVIRPNASSAILPTSSPSQPALSLTGEYKVALDLTTPAFLYSDGTTLEEALGESHPQAHDLPSLKIQSEPINMNLVESQPTLQRRAERFHPGDCNGNQDVTNARNNAKDLARHAEGTGNAALWELYFNNGDQRATVSNAYQGYRTMTLPATNTALPSNAVFKTRTRTPV
ncbi:MAG: hypothetical protein Q9226_008473 [Calogaya cf. arnoldii]